MLLFSYFFCYFCVWHADGHLSPRQNDLQGSQWTFLCGKSKLLPFCSGDACRSCCYKVAHPFKTILSSVYICFHLCEQLWPLCHSPIYHMPFSACTRTACHGNRASWARTEGVAWVGARKKQPITTKASWLVWWELIV